MRRWLGLCAAGLMAAHAAPASAHWAGARIGGSFAALKADYPEAVEIRRDAAGPHALELVQPTYAGVSWAKARLVFDAADRLDHVTFEARSQDFDAVKARVDAVFRRRTPETGAVLSRFAIPGAIEMRICQTGADRVEVTFEDMRLDT